MRRPVARPGRWGTIGVLLLMLLQDPGAAQAPAVESRVKVEAAFLRNFARYVTWPADAFSGERSPWTVCILGDAHFDDALEKTFLGRTEHGRAFEVVRAGLPEQLPACHIVYVGYPGSSRRRAALQALQKRPVLTVGSAPEFLEEGGIVRLLPGERIEMSINLDQARAVSLAIPAKVLEVSKDVIENGAVRRVRR
jgi:hypothetical protein